MANTKITQHVIADDAITTAMITDANITPAKLHGTLDLSSKTLTIPAVAIPSASTATTQSAADNSTKVATTAYVETAISNLVDSSPSSLNTLNELAAALNDDASFSSTVTASIATKLPLAGGTMTGAIAMGTSKITGLGDPTASQDAGTKTYIDTADALKLNLSGGTLTGDLILNTTTALRIPAGTTGERPTAATGQIRWNTSDGALEVYNGSAWTAVGTGSSNKVLDTFTGDNSTTDFTLSVTPANEDALMVFIDGVYQEKGDYTLTNAVLALDTAPASGEKIAVHITTATVHDGTSATNQQFTATAGQTAFTLSADPKSENNTQVYINGVYQQKTDYTVSGTTLTFDTGLTVGDVVEVNAFTVSTLGNTDTMAEGTTNLYHTTARARSAISVSGSALAYNSSTGVITSAYEESPTFTGTVTSAGLIVDTNTLVVDATNNRLGIGTTNPATNLHIDGVSNYNGVEIKGSGGSRPMLQFSNANNGDLGAIYGTEGNDLVICAGSSNAAAITIDSSGHVGIGTDSPNAPLEVNGGVGMTGGWGRSLVLRHNFPTLVWQSEYSTDAYAGIGYDNTTGMHFMVNSPTIDVFASGNTSAMFIKDDKNIGIGDTNPQHPLKVHLTNGEVAMFGSNGMNSPGQYAGIGLGQVLANATSHQKIKLVGEGRNSGSYVSDFHILVDTASDSGDAVLADSKFEIDGGTGAINMSSQPSALIYNVSTHTQAGGSAQYTFPTTAYNVGGCYNVNNGRFTVTTPGKYLVNCQLSLNASTAAQTYLAMGPRLNDTGTVFFGGWSVKTTTANQYGAHTQSIVLDLQANDFLVFYIELSATAVVLPGPHHTSVSVHKLS